MTISLMRESLKKLISDDLKDAHAGLLMQRGLTKWDKDDKQAKAELIQKIVKIPTPKKDSLYALAFTRWVRATSDTDRFATLAAGISGRLYTGLNSAGALETGISTSHTYGMPLIAGSSVKGIARSHAESLGLDKAHLTVLFGDDSDSGSLKSGALVWHDAWFIPANTPPFAAEIITTHHQDYYNGKQLEADEMESPHPQSANRHTRQLLFRHRKRTGRAGMGGIRPKPTVSSLADTRRRQQNRIRLRLFYSCR